MTIAIPMLEDYVTDPWTTETLTTDDGYQLTARFYLPPESWRKPWQGSVIIASAMAVPQDFYTAFAQWLARCGYVAVTFDYRGMGLSQHGALCDVTGDLLTWAEQDCAAVINAVSKRTPNLPITWLGHSIGGQLLPFVAQHQRVGQLITIGTGSGYWRDNAPELKRRVWLLWYGLAPILTPLFGYFPGGLFNMVGNLPAGVVNQWRKWCVHPDYVIGVEGESARIKFAAVKAPVLSLSFSDDEFMSAESTRALHALYSGAEREMQRISPQDAGVKRIGHFGFFKAEMEQTLWERYLRPVL